MHDVTMKLDEYMELHSLTDAAFAAMVGKDRTMIGRYRRGDVIPPADVIHEIQVLTKYAVQFNDWIGK